MDSIIDTIHETTVRVAQSFFSLQFVPNQPKIAIFKPQKLFKKLSTVEYFLNFNRKVFQGFLDIKTSHSKMAS